MSLPQDTAAPAFACRLSGRQSTPSSAKLPIVIINHDDEEGFRQHQRDKDDWVSAAGTH